MPPSGNPSELLSRAALANGLALLAAVLYLLGLVTLVLRRRYRQAGSTSALDALPVLVGFIAHGTAFVLRALAVERFPVTNLAESFGFLALLLAAAYLFAAARFRYPAFDGLLLVLVLVFLGLSFLLPQAAGAPPRGRWFVFHIMLAFLGVTALFAACLASILYLLADRQLKSKRPSLLLRFLPSLVACDRTALRLLQLGFPLLTLGIVTGFFWWREGGRLSLGPKEFWALVGWTIYGSLLFARVVRGYSGRRAAILAVTGAVAVLGAILGIRL